MKEEWRKMTHNSHAINNDLRVIYTFHKTRRNFYMNHQASSTALIFSDFRNASKEKSRTKFIWEIRLNKDENCIPKEDVSYI